MKQAVKDSRCSIVTVYHGGGRGGIHPSWKSFPLPLNYVLFDPEAGALKDLQEGRHDSGGGVRLSVEGVGLWSEPGPRALHVYSVPGCSSLLDLDREATHRYNRSGIHKTADVTIQCDTIDGRCRRRREKPDFLCLDTQGTELGILHGAVAALEDCLIGLRVEVEFAPLYKNQPLFDDVWRFLRGFGFLVARIERTGDGVPGTSTDGGPFSVSMADAAPAWADVLFLKSREYLFGDRPSGRRDAEKLLKFTLFALANGCGSLGLDMMCAVADMADLVDLLAALDPEDCACLLRLSRAHLKTAEGSTWETDARRLAEYAPVRARLHRELERMHGTLCGGSRRRGANSSSEEAR